MKKFYLYVWKVNSENETESIMKGIEYFGTAAIDDAKYYVNACGFHAQVISEGKSVFTA